MVHSTIFDTQMSVLYRGVPLPRASPKFFAKFHFIGFRPPTENTRTIIIMRLKFTVVKLVIYAVLKLAIDRHFSISVHIQFNIG